MPLEKISRRTFLTQAGMIGLSLFFPYKKANAAVQTISSLPAVITTPGDYVLNQDFNVNLDSQAAILIQADDVTLDLQNHTITNTYGDTTHAAGIAVTTQRRVTIRNGRLENFYTSILSLSNGTDGSSHHIENMEAIDFYAGGIIISGDNASVRGCTVDTSVRNSDISLGGCTALIGIDISLTLYSLITDNTINLRDMDNDQGTIGIFSNHNCLGAVVYNNDVQNCYGGLVFDSNSNRGPEYKNNSTTNVTVGYVNGFDRGSNT